jgi:predicted permease
MWLTGVLVAATLASALLAAVVAMAVRLPWSDFGVFVQAGFRGNLLFVGLPIVVFAVDGRGDGGDIKSLAIVALAPLVPVYNVLGVLVLLISQHQVNLAAVGRVLKALVTNPLIIAAAAGVLLSVSGSRLPTPLARTLSVLGQTAPALALISLGAAMAELRVRGQLVRAVLAAVIKVAAVPAIVLAACLFMRLTPQQTLVAMIFAACPTAGVSYVLTTQLGGNAALAASAVVTSTLLSLVSLVLVLTYIA